MSRYDNYSGSGNSTGGNNYDDTTLKLQKYAAIRVTGKRVRAIDTEYGDKFIAGFDDASVLDGIVFQRDDKPDTWKVFGFGDLGFNVGEDGLVYSDYDAESGEFSGEMSADDILDHARVQGFSETFGGDSYWYTPVGVVIEEGDDVAVNDDLLDEPEETEIPVGEVSMLLSNKSWVRALAKLLTTTGDDIIARTENDEGNTVPVTDSRNWLTDDEPELRGGLEGRDMELFIIEETQTFDGEEVTYTTPVLLDGATGERITVDNDAEDLEETDNPEQEPDNEMAGDTEQEKEVEKAVADGGAASAETQAEPSTETTASPDTTDDAGTDGDVPEELDDLIDYFARTQGEVEPDELREFAEDEVSDPDSVDWEAGAAEVERRA